MQCLGVAKEGNIKRDPGLKIENSKSFFAKNSQKPHIMDLVYTLDTQN